MDNDRQKDKGKRHPDSQYPSEYYEILVQGHLDSLWGQWFDGMTLTNVKNGEMGIPTMIAPMILSRNPCIGFLLLFDRIAIINNQENKPTPIAAHTLAAYQPLYDLKPTEVELLVLENLGKLKPGCSQPKNTLPLQTPRMVASKDTIISSPSEIIFFHSLKCSQGAVRLPTRVSLPLDF